MTPVVVVLLGALWAWYLVGWARGRAEHRNVNSISAFSKHLDVLERAAPVTSRRATVAPYSAGPARRGSSTMTLSQAQRRRRDVLVGLAAACMLSLVLAGAVGGIFVPVFLVSLAVLGGYLVMLGRNRAIREEQERKVLHLYPEDDWDENYDEELYWEEAPAYAARSV